jgi:hypothetical protein
VPHDDGHDAEGKALLPSRKPLTCADG